jgi:4-alpha-glucanotransferase
MPTKTSRATRRSGILLHPTSLPGPFGVGDLGPAASQFLDFLAASGQALWQVMPLGPTGYGDSPYQSGSAFGGNPLLISPEQLVQEGLLRPEDFAGAPSFAEGAVDFGAVIPWKMALLRKSFARFQAGGNAEARTGLADFGARNHAWVNDYALFAALKELHQGKAWNEWEPKIARRQPAAIAHWSKALREQVQFYTYLQFLFERQWGRLRRYANERGISVIGDIPIFVAYDSADVWANPELFSLEEDGLPSVVAGVPPDYFSPTGQLWGNPLYRWEAMAARGYSWWVERFRALLGRVDIVRLDHFRGFAGYWEIPAGEKTAINGRWVTGPGRALFDAVSRELGALPIIAEDLGVITPDVEALRDGLGFPGMKILQFAFGGTHDTPYLPHNHPTRSVAYTGTHDNDTTVGWWSAAAPHEQQHLAEYVGHEVTEPSWELIRLALASPAEVTLIPLQDLLSLGSEARMNTPSRPSGNWSWRYLPTALSPALAARLRKLSYLYGRVEKPEPSPPAAA